MAGFHELAQPLGRLLGLAYPEDQRDGWLGWVPREPAYRPLRPRMDPWGALIHTSGSGVIERALRAGWPDDPEAPSPFDVALEYHRKKAASHFDIGTEGEFGQLLPYNRRGAHANSPYRRRLLGGHFEADMRRRGRDLPLELWRARWPGFASPQYLYPSRSPNGCYVAIELVPLAEPLADGLRFTPEQHKLVALICVGIAARERWPDGWHRTPRLAGHEDVSPYKRWQPAGGWDPGALRRVPRLDWERICREIEREMG